MVMMKSSRAAEQKPLIPPRRRSLIHTRKFAKNVAFSFPDSHQLIVTTPRSVFVWSKDGILPVFQTTTNGIVAARKTAEGGEVLAVADSQVVLLHDMKKGNERTYKLKGSDVRAGHGQSDTKLISLRAMFVCFDMHKRRTTYFSPPPSRMPCEHTL